MTHQNIVIIGATGAIGKALVTQYSNESHNQVFAFSRSPQHVPSAENVIHGTLDFNNEVSISNAAQQVSDCGGADIVCIATGLLHQDSIQPEKSIKRLSADNMAHILFANTVGPSLVLKHFMPIMSRHKSYVIAALSARVGSISDNGLGGWYSYRASKAALNMVLKTASIEAARLNHQSIIVGLHPGTVNSDLSKPFQSGVSQNKLFSPAFSAQQLIEVISGLSPQNTGHVFAWDGHQIPS